jgi:hypothetical protein
MEPATPRAAVAVCVDGADAEWLSEQGTSTWSSRAPGDEFPAGVYCLGRGVAQLRMDSDVLLTLEAPARLELIDPYNTRLYAGRLYAVVPPEASASDFAVGTPWGTVVDQGTAFGVAVTPDERAIVQVDQGQVEIVLDSATPGQPELRRRVWPQTAIQIGRDRSVEPDIMPFEPRRFVREVPPAPVGMAELPAAEEVLLDEIPSRQVCAIFARNSAQVRCGLRRLRPHRELAANRV